MTKEDIAKVLKQLRTSAGLTQKEAAERLGKKQQTIASWESGQSQPDANTLFIICSLYGTSVDEAFGFKKDGTTIGKKDIDLIEKYHSLDDSGRHHVDIILQWESDRVARLLAYAEKLSNYQRANEPAANSSKVINTPEHLIANAAHDMGATPEQKANADRIMMDDDEWK